MTFLHKQNTLIDNVKNIVRAKKDYQHKKQMGKYKLLSK